MGNNEAIEDLIWLDELLAKGVVSELEAACCLAGYGNQNDVKISSDAPHPDNLHWSDIINPVVSKLYEIITSWPNVTRYKPLLWYIEQAVIKKMPHVRYDLLLPKCKENEYRCKECIDEYPELAKKLGLTTNNFIESNEVSLPSEKIDVKMNELLVLPKNQQSESLSPDNLWKKSALTIYNELRKGRERLSSVTMSRLVEKEMKKRHEAGEKGMTKRGGREVPAASSIRRSALKKLPS